MPIILVTHDLEESALLADRMALLYKGQVLQTGTPEFVALHPVSATEARLMNQQNLFTAQVLYHSFIQHIAASPRPPIPGIPEIKNQPDREYSPACGQAQPHRAQ